jgi:hypothetical protein
VTAGRRSSRLSLGQCLLVRDVSREYLRRFLGN